MDMRASATADVCSHCLSKLFDINIDSEEIDDINIRDGEVKINITEEKVSIWPEIPEWGKTPHAAFQWGWKGRIISWPFTIVGILMDWGIVKSERKKGYLAGSVGAFLWFSLLFILIFILLQTTLLYLQTVKGLVERQCTNNAIIANTQKKHRDMEHINVVNVDTFTTIPIHLKQPKLFKSNGDQ